MRVATSMVIPTGCARLLLATRSRAQGRIRRLCLVPFEEAYESGFEDMQRHIPDTSKIEALIDWRPTRTLDEVVEDVIESQRAPQALAESA